MKTTDKNMKRVLEESIKAANLQSLSYLVSWDQETHMPKGGIAIKPSIMAFLAQERHKILTSKKLVASLESLQGASHISADEQVIVKRLYHDIKKEQRLGKSFVKKFSKETSLSIEEWKIAHKSDNFKKFSPSLKKIVSLCRKKADLLGYVDHPYDALLDQFESGMTTKQLDTIFGELKPKLISLVKKITQKNAGKETLAISGHYPEDAQRALSHDAIRRIGVNPDQYDLATTHHPFCIPLHPNDVRITTHFHEKDPLKGFFASVHEAGHGLYENNMDENLYGTPLAEAASIGIHESQSRVFETCIGNSLPFWKFYYPKFQKSFPEALKDVPMESFVNSVRAVKPSLIRIFADEVTYCLHVILRYEIEKSLIEGSIEVKNVPSIWKAKMQEYLGVFPPSDATGCLQDVHWSMGCFGYFPTYALGSMYSGSLFTKYLQTNVNWASEIANGDFSSFSTFLKERVHVHGRRYLPLELIEKATGKPFTPNDYISYLEHRYLT